MADLTGVHVALDLCPAHVACPRCQDQADAVSRLIDERMAVAYAPVHELMRAWAHVASLTPLSSQQMLAKQHFSHVLEGLRKAVGHEGEQS